MQTCVKYTSTKQVFSSWLSLWRTGGQGHHGPVDGPFQIIQQIVSTQTSRIAHLGCLFCVWPFTCKSPTLVLTAAKTGSAFRDKMMYMVLVFRIIRLWFQVKLSLLNSYHGENGDLCFARPQIIHTCVLIGARAEWCDFGSGNSHLMSADLAGLIVGPRWSGSWGVSHIRNTVCIPPFVLHHLCKSYMSFKVTPVVLKERVG